MDEWFLSARNSQLVVKLNLTRVILELLTALLSTDWRWATAAVQGAVERRWTSRLDWRAVFHLKTKALPTNAPSIPTFPPLWKGWRGAQRQRIVPPVWPRIRRGNGSSPVANERSSLLSVCKWKGKAHFEVLEKYWRGNKYFEAT